jgi:FtsP/CotA-like multicopper oxidase with cupredoxin domain
MGSGMGPMDMAAPQDQGTVLDDVRNPECTISSPKSSMCYKDNRATLHLHGGITPWISDGTPHQWITPAGEDTPYPQGVSTRNVPDMVDGAGAEVCAAKDDGCSTFYYTNQQSARLMFYHDHSYGITRLNVYAGEAAGYQITDPTEKKLVNDGTIPGAADTIPLIVQDRTFVPGDEQLYDVKDADGNITSYGQDPTWNADRWGTKGSFWYHHVYMPAQNPGDPSGMSAYGRWMYGPWFWPPANGTVHGPIDNPYYDPACNLDKPDTWTYQTDPFCEPEKIPGTPNISMGMEQFNDTPLVNGVAYPTTTLDPKSYRLRFLNAANDRFFNLQWYLADKSQGDGTTEVALKPGELAAAQTDPVVSPTPVDANNDAAGPDWVQIANEGGFLPAPAVIDGQQPTTWITDPTRFDVGNVDKHSLLLAPAERADVIVDFSRFAGETLILYNDAPAAFPARVPSYDYYTGAPDLSPVGAPTPLPGYGPNTRTVMQVKIADTAQAPAFNVANLRKAFQHHLDGSGVFESGQNPVIVGQAAYNSAYGSDFAASSNCNVKTANISRCDGLVRVNDGTTVPFEFGFNTLRAQKTRMSMRMEPKAIHDEMNSSTFDGFGRMQANLGIEAQPPNPALQNVTLYPYVNPQTELIDATNLPKAAVDLGADGLPAKDVQVAPIADAGDGTQIWRFTHNGVDTHPIHFHLYDVQVLNRVTWDNIVIPPDENELGWKDTVRMSPLEDTIVALRPVIPKTSFEVPNSVRVLNPAMPLGDTTEFNNIDPQGNPTGNVVNNLVNFGWEYVLHCHILSHEEMDMMRPVSVALPPIKPDGLTSALVGSGNNARFQLSWNDNSITETSFLVQRTTDGTTWVDAGTVTSPLDQPNTKGVTRSFRDQGSNRNTAYLYRVVARNTVGYGGAFPEMTVGSTSDPVGVNLPAKPAAPSTLSASIASATRVNLSWRDNASTETGFVVERATGTSAFAKIGTAPARSSTGGTVTFTDTAAAAGASYRYRVTAVNLAGASAPSNVASLDMVAPTAPSGVTGTAARSGSGETITVRWTPTSNNAASFRVEWSATSAFTSVAGTAPAGGGATQLTTPRIARQAWFVRVVAVNPLGQATSAVVSVPSA